MVALTVTQAYATVAEADTYLENNAAWNAATDETKADALLFGRYYIDTHFSCIDLTNETVIPDELKYGNSLLAADHTADSSVFDAGANVRRELAQAGSVIAETEYFGGKTNKPPSLNTVKGVLKSICSYSSASPFLIRA